MKPAQHQALADMFTSDIRQALYRHCSLTTRAARGTTALRFALVDAAAPDPVLNTLATSTPYVSGAPIWEAVDKRGGTTSFAENTLNTSLDIDRAFKAWSRQPASRPVQAGVCRA